MLETLVDVIVTCHFLLLLFMKHPISMIYSHEYISVVDTRFYYNLCPVFSSARL